eukprot:m51a1_g233 hypothetical protein (430) ;mRNA; r:118173-119547
MVSIGIELDGSPVFVAGEPRAVAGTVRLHTATALRATSVTTALVCRAGASFISNGGGRAVRYSRQHEFVRRECRWEPPGHVVAAGATAVAFDLGTLGADWLVSYEEHTSLLRAFGGFVRYWLEVTVATPLGSFDVRRWAPLTVLSLRTPMQKLADDRARLERMLAAVRHDPGFRLRTPAPAEADLWKPFACQESKAFGFPYITRGKIEVSLRLPRLVYGFGEVIAATVHVRNGSSTAVRDVEAWISQRCYCNPGDCPPGRWCRVLATVSTGCAVEAGKEADVLVHLRAPAASTSFALEHDEFHMSMRHSFDVDVRYKGFGRRLSASVAIDLNSVPRGAEAGQWGQGRIAELAGTVRPCIPWKVYDSEGDMLKGPHVQALCVPVDRAFASQRPLYGQTFVSEDEPLCSEPCFVAVDTDPALYKFQDWASD